MGVLIRPIDREHRWILTPCYPTRGPRTIPPGWSVAVIGVGGNVGDVVRRLCRLWYALKRTRTIHPLASSPILRNPPFGYTRQGPFDNAVIIVATPLRPIVLLRRLQEIERRFGRRRSFPNAPRTLDLDLIFYDARRIVRPDLIVPHPGWRERVSVRWPLARLGSRRRLPHRVGNETRYMEKGWQWSKRRLKRRAPKRRSPWR